MPILLSSAGPTVQPPVTTPSTPLPPIDPYVWRDHFPGLSSVTWVGWDDSSWLIGACGDIQSGVVLGRRVRGLHFGELEEWESESPAVDGATPLGYRAKVREVFLTLRVYQHTSSREWVDYDRRFWRSMLPAAPGLRGPGHLVVAAPDGSRRWLELYPSHRGDHEFDVDPARRGWAVYGQYLRAYRPYWTSDPIPARPFTQGGTSSFFGGATGAKGPPFVIGPGSSFASAAITNPGDEPAWPVWTLRGPFTSAQIGVPGQQTTITATVAAGDFLTVVTDPLAQTITNSAGALVMPGLLGGAPFAPIPPGENMPLATAMTGTGSIQVAVQPLYHRAW